MVGFQWAARALQLPLLTFMQPWSHELWNGPLPVCLAAILAQSNSFAKNPFVNHCRKVLEQLPLVLIEGKIENHQLHVLASTAQALCPNAQSCPPMHATGPASCQEGGVSLETDAEADRNDTSRSDVPVTLQAASQPLHNGESAVLLTTCLPQGTPKRLG